MVFKFLWVDLNKVVCDLVFIVKVKVVWGVFFMGGM